MGKNAFYLTDKLDFGIHGSHRYSEGCEICARSPLYAVDQVFPIQEQVPTPVQIPLSSSAAVGHG